MKTSLMLQLLFLTTSLGCHLSRLSIVHVETTSKPTDLAAPPESLPKFVQCQCKLSFKNPCGTKILSYCNRLSLSQLVESRSEGCKNIEENVDEESGD